MHELSLVQSLLEIVDEHASSHGFERVNSLTLSYGRLAGIEESALAFGFEVLSKGTRAQGAQLILEVSPGRLQCLQCLREFETGEFAHTCPGCGSLQVVLIGGLEELRLLEMDVD